jgi:hypothetical protein
MDKSAISDWGTITKTETFNHFRCDLLAFLEKA